MTSFIVPVPKVFSLRNRCIMAGMLLSCLRPSQCAKSQNSSCVMFLNVLAGLLVLLSYSHHPRMNQLRRCILTPIDSLVVEGASIARIFLRHRSMAFSGISTFGTMFPFVPLLLMTLYPRKSKPSVTWVTFVFSSDNVSPMVLRNPPSSSLMAWAPAFVPFQNTTKSRVKERLSDGRQGLSITAGSPLAVPH